MDAIIALTKLDFPLLFLSVCAALFGMKTILSLFEWFIRLLGLETKWMRSKREDHELLLTTSQNLLLLQEHHKRDMEKSDLLDQEMRDDIKRLTDLFIEKEIDDIRWEINNFATKVAEGKPCNKDSFSHCIRSYERYEQLLEENGLENGEVELSMEIIEEAYKRKLKEGF
ncbi:MAG: hypothetical protein HFI40_06405 [Lachnospiraceae bacterium]|jgi:hypothetical protein|nr:hypothetical protein [Lachnospiraceae bacterium]